MKALAVGLEPAWAPTSARVVVDLKIAAKVVAEPGMMLQELVRRGAKRGIWSPTVTAADPPLSS